jgi:hypothetical protein
MSEQGVFAEVTLSPPVLSTKISVGMLDCVWGATARWIARQSCCHFARLLQPLQSTLSAAVDYFRRSRLKPPQLASLDCFNHRPQPMTVFGTNPSDRSRMAFVKRLEESHDWSKAVD